MRFEDQIELREGWLFAKGDRWYSGAGLCRMASLLVDEQVHLVPSGMCIWFAVRSQSHHLLPL